MIREYALSQSGAYDRATLKTQINQVVLPEWLFLKNSWQACQYPGCRRCAGVSSIARSQARAAYRSGYRGDYRCERCHGVL
ncbi:hypothetical protein Bxe_C1249 [Paraburkholderia xenovorans LB400]|uniref:Uncharacterized protein n=1 Tax=Paraburkholderia xenovorans (strain LB400) TaxID=266265 RepID=Q13FN0_PARXL|nr:hypothetical protein Bxe_C1249 [Paraburkholderia xenovorans LB400]